MPEQQEQCMYCDHIMGIHYMIYDPISGNWSCKSMTSCVHRMEIARKYPRPVRKLKDEQGRAS
jgi:hypothetical protein